MPVTKATRYVKELEDDNGKLRALIQRMIEMAEGIEWILDYHNHSDKAQELGQLVQDCQKVIEARGMETDEQ